MIYLSCYLFIGFLLVALKSPIRKLVDSEVTKIEISNAFSDDKVPAVKIVLLRIILSAALILIYPIMLFSEFKEKRAKRSKIKGELEAKQQARRKWLQYEISVKKAEAKYMVVIDNENIPFGYMHTTWIKLLNRMQDGDKLHEYKSSDGSPGQLTGQEGIALTRNGKIVLDLATRLD